MLWTFAVIYELQGCNSAACRIRQAAMRCCSGLAAGRRSNNDLYVGPEPPDLGQDLASIETGNHQVEQHRADVAMRHAKDLDCPAATTIIVPTASLSEIITGARLAMLRKAEAAGTPIPQCQVYLSLMSRRQSDLKTGKTAGFSGTDLSRN